MGRVVRLQVNERKLALVVKVPKPVLLVGEVVNNVEVAPMNEF